MTELCIFWMKYALGHVKQEKKKKEEQRMRESNWMKKESLAELSGEPAQDLGGLSDAVAAVAEDSAGQVDCEMSDWSAWQGCSCKCTGPPWRAHRWAENMVEM